MTAWHQKAVWMRQQGYMLKVIAADLGVSLRSVSKALSPQDAENQRTYCRKYMRRRRAKESTVDSDSACE